MSKCIPASIPARRSLVSSGMLTVLGRHVLERMGIMATKTWPCHTSVSRFVQAWSWTSAQAEACGSLERVTTHASGFVFATLVARVEIR